MDFNTLMNTIYVLAMAVSVLLFVVRSHDPRRVPQYEYVSVDLSSLRALNGRELPQRARTA